jgi:cytoskeletal protein RodZ
MTFLHKSVGGEHGLFGSDLRDLRELHGISFERACAETKIDSEFLRAFEEDRILAVSDPIFAERHFLSYVRYLGGHEPYFKSKYDELVRERKASRNFKEMLPRERSVRFWDLFVAPQFLAFAGIALLALLFSGYVMWQAFIIRTPPQLIISSPQDGEKLVRSRVAVEGVTAPEASVTVNGRSAPVDQSGHFSLELDVKRGTTRIRITAQKRHGSEKIIERNVRFGEEVLDASSFGNATGTLIGSSTGTAMIVPAVTSTAATSTAVSSTSTKK